jgi:hypothetical protein
MEDDRADSEDAAVTTDTDAVAVEDDHDGDHDDHASIPGAESSYQGVVPQLLPSQASFLRHSSSPSLLSSSSSTSPTSDSHLLRIPNPPALYQQQYKHQIQIQL